jgi:hypothetical protein
MLLPIPPLGPLNGLIYFWLSLECSCSGNYSMTDFLVLLNRRTSPVTTFCKLPIRRKDLLSELQHFVHIFPNSGFGIVLLWTKRGVRVRVFRITDDVSDLDSNLIPLVWWFPSLKVNEHRVKQEGFDQSRLIHVENTPAANVVVSTIDAEAKATLSQLNS